MVLVRNIMRREVVTAKPNITLKEASKVMTSLKIGSLVITQNDKIIGILTGTDILKAIAENKDVDTTLAEEIMKKNVITIDADEKIETAANLMVENRIKKLPVVDNGKLVGIVSASDIIAIEPKLIQNLASLIALKLPGYSGG
ncbi:MAG: CBS domain-containing protein [Candidatus Aenigmatarchaeota archaeon]